ncbi:MAG: hypothetical protein AB8H12_08345 [Lewinella sp.]
MKKIKFILIILTLSLAIQHTVLCQSSVVVQQFTSPTLEVLQGSGRFFLSSPPKLDLQNNTAASEVPSFFKNVLSITSKDQLDGLCDKKRSINDNILSRSVSEINNFRAKGNILFVEAIIYFTFHQENYCFVKFSVPSAGPEGNIYSTYLFRKENETWLYALNNPMPMQTFAILALKPEALKSLLTNTTNTSQIKKDLPAYCFGTSNSATDLRTIGRELISYFAPKTENPNFTNEYCHPIKLR